MSRLCRAALLTALVAAGCRDSTTLAPTGPAVRPEAVVSSVTTPSGERILGQTALIPIYSFSGGIIYGSTPKFVALWPAHAAPAAQSTFYLVVYPIGSTVTPLQCYDVPNETCPDHGPVIAGFAMQLNPGVYGGGVLGHDHFSPPHGSGAFHATEYPVLVLFTSAAAANQQFATKADVDAAALRGEVFMVPGQAFSFLNAIVNGQVYDNGTAWVCPAYTRCARPGDPPGHG